jgi:hypothetical protein
MLPFTFNDVNVPTLVILGCAFVVTVPAVAVEPAVIAYVALATVPTILAPDKFVNPLPLPANLPVVDVIFVAVIFPLTANEDSVPTEVILG